MTEPKTVASRLAGVVPGLLHWTVDDDRIGSRSDAYALVTGNRVMLIDPLPLSERALTNLGIVTAICLTIQSHQRSAWRYRKRFGAPVFAPRRAEGLEENPDHFYDQSDHLPGSLVAMHAPGPCDASFVLFARPPAAGGSPILFIGDLLTRDTTGQLEFVPDEYQDAPRLTRRSVHALLDRPELGVLCPGHGAPLVRGTREALEDALARDRQRR